MKASTKRNVAEDDTDNMMWKSFTSVACGAVLIALPVLLTNLFDGVATDLQLDHYAERPGWAGAYLPFWLPLPADTLVNVGYLVVGIAWLKKVHRLQTSDRLTSDLCYPFYVFGWMSVIYGQVQCVRLLTRLHWSAVLDQWYTFPIFAWVGVWSADICCQIQNSRTLSKFTVGFFMFLSILSYGLALLHHYGFEMALTLHIVAVVVFAWRVHCLSAEVDRKQRTNEFCKALICCAGFVLLKMADHKMAAAWPQFFTILSGHFWSKVADFLQIHYTCNFFLKTVSDKTFKSC